MSQPAYDCASIMEEAKALAEKNIRVKAKPKMVWHDIGGLDRRTMEKGNINFTLCKEVVVEHPTQMPTASAEFLEAVAEGDRICWNAQIEQSKAANKYPFQGRTFTTSHTFQPQLAPPSWGHSHDAW